eukprot:1156772-Pelagomonas_calceolata.AAC.14
MPASRPSYAAGALLTLHELCLTFQIPILQSPSGVVPYKLICAEHFQDRLPRMLFYISGTQAC